MVVITNVNLNLKKWEIISPYTFEVIRSLIAND
jgi:hypothetical protein